MTFKVLVMGLSGAGKTTLAAKIAEHFDSVTQHNADVIRKETNNWDFGTAGRVAQSYHMSKLAKNSDSEVVICDFIAPLPELRKLFDADYIVWVDTVSSSEYTDTDQLFVPPTNADYIVKTHNDADVMLIVNNIKDLLNG